MGSGIFKSDDPAARAKAVVEATTHYQDPKSVAKASTGLKNAMKGLDMSEIPEEERETMGLSDSLVRISIGLDHDIERTYNTMVDCMKKVGIL